MSSESARTSKKMYVVVYSFVVFIVIGNLLLYSIEHLI